MRKWWFTQLGSRLHTRKKTRNNGCRCQSLSWLSFHPIASETSPPRAQELKAENRCGSGMPSPSLGRDSGVGTAVTSRERLSSPESLGPGALALQGPLEGDRVQAVQSVQPPQAHGDASESVRLSPQLLSSERGVPSATWTARGPAGPCTEHCTTGQSKDHTPVAPPQQWRHFGADPRSSRWRWVQITQPAWPGKEGDTVRFRRVPPSVTFSQRRRRSPVERFLSRICPDSGKREKLSHYCPPTPTYPSTSHPQFNSTDLFRIREGGGYTKKSCC